MPFLLEVSIVVVAITGSLFLALFTFFKNSRSDTNRYFFLFTLSIAIYLVLNYYLNHQTTAVDTLFWVRMVMSIAVIVDLLFFFLAVTFPQQKLPLKKLTFWLWILFSFILVVLAQMNLIFVHAEPFGGPGTPGPALPLFIMHTVLSEGLAFFMLIKRRSKVIGKEKAQINLFLLGAVLMFASILITNFVFILLFHTAAFIGLLPVYALIFISCISYAIVRHRFLDIRLLVARSVGYALVLLLFGGAYSGYIFFIGSLFLHIHFSLNNFLFYGTITLALAFTFQPLRGLFEKFTDKLFYRGFYDPQLLLKNLSDVMSSTIVLDMLTSKILEKMLDVMHITTGSFVLLEKENNREIDYVQSIGYTNKPQFDKTKIKELLDQKKIIIFEDLEEGPTKQTMRDYEVHAVLPLTTTEREIGVVLFGEKADGDIYSEKEINIFLILAPQLSVAIQNSKEYEEIKRFNITLREEIEKATKELTEANEKLKVLDKAKDEFVSLASHELRTPMTAIKSYVWMALDGRAGELSEKLKYYLTRAYMSTNRLINLVNDMLNISRIESGRLTIQMESTDILKLTQEVLEEVTPRANELGISVSVEQPTTPLSPVLADVDKIKEVLINLIGNSLKFTTKGGFVKVVLGQKDDMVEVKIIDNGTGIAPEDLPKLFQKFAMLEGSYTANQPVQGTGLGLYICKSLIGLHQGTISAASEGKGKGATFSFTLKVFHQEDVAKYSVGGNGSKVGLVRSRL